MIFTNQQTYLPLQASIHRRPPPPRSIHPVQFVVIVLLDIEDNWAAHFHRKHQPCCHTSKRHNNMPASFPLRREYRDSQAVVRLTDEARFRGLCDAQLESLRIPKLDRAEPIFGSAYLNEKNTIPTYMGKIREFVRFLMNNPEFYPSLPFFYEFTPRGVITIQAQAVCVFMYLKLGAAGTIAKDKQVSNNVPFYLPLTHRVDYCSHVYRDISSI